jgi:hypothetical protein
MRLRQGSAQGRRARPAVAPDDPAVPVFSERLSEVLDAVFKGEAPNAGRFCGYCYTPIDAQRARCPHCDKPTSEKAPVDKVPREVLTMFRSMRRRESLVVNSLAYAGLLLGVLIFIGVFYVIFTLGAGIWWYVFDIVLLFVLARVLAGLLGGYLGDELGYRYARRKLAEEWSAHEAGRGEAGP